MPEDENDAETQKTVTHLCKEVRSRVLDLARGGDPVLIKKIFGDFDLNSSGALTIEREISGPQQIADIQNAKRLLEALLQGAG